VRLSDLLKLCCVKSPKEGARHVAFRGPKKELPQGQDGSYGTSLKWEYAVDPANDVLVAYKHNGRYLTPDHGFPVRMIIPGFIGGRMVKYVEVRRPFTLCLYIYHRSTVKFAVVPFDVMTWFCLTHCRRLYAAILRAGS
jgi:hypothetical protein